MAVFSGNGSNTAPSFTFSSDTNTGMYRVGADSLALSTAGVAALAIDSAQRVGIGTLTPSTELEVTSYGTGNAAGPTITVFRDSASPANQDRIGEVLFKGRDSAAAIVEYKSIYTQIESTTSGAATGKLFIGNTSAGADAQVTIDGAGRVGIGTQTADGLVTIAATQTINFGNGAPAGRIGSILMTLPSGGTQGAGNYGAGLMFSGINQSSRRTGIIAKQTGSDPAQVGLSFCTNNGVANTTAISEKMVLTSDGRLLINDAAPGAILAVKGLSTDQAAIFLQGANTSDCRTIVAQATTGQNVGFWVDGSNLRHLVSGTDDVITFSGNQNLSLYTDGQIRQRITPTGNILVNTTTTPTGALTQYSALAVSGNTVSAAGPAYVSLHRGQNTIDTTSGNTLGILSFGDRQTGEYASIRAVAGAANTPGSDTPGRLGFACTELGGTSPVERFRIENTGQSIAYGDTSAMVVTSGVVDSSTVVFAVHRGATGTNSVGNPRLEIQSSGGVYNVTGVYTTGVSDERLKQDIVDASSQWDDIKGIRLTNYRYKNDPDGELMLGPIAQELELVSPGLIIRRPATEEEIADPSNGLGEGDEVLTYKMSILYMKAVGALQEAMARIEALEAQVAALS